MKEYTVEIAGIEHTMLLSDDDAKRLGAKVIDAPENKVVKATESKTTKKG